MFSPFRPWGCHKSLNFLGLLLYPCWEAPLLSFLTCCFSKGKPRSVFTTLGNVWIQEMKADMAWARVLDAGVVSRPRHLDPALPSLQHPLSTDPSQICMVAGGTHFRNKKSSATAHSFHPGRRSQTENLCVNMKSRSPLTRRLCSSKVISFSLKAQFAVTEHWQDL